MSWRAWATAELETIEEQDRRRRVVDLDARGPIARMPDGREVVAFASNDYLGLGSHPDVVAGARAALERWGAGSGAARLIVGSRPVHSQLERDLADWKGTDRAVLFPTGFAANVGVLSVLGAAGTLICSDALNHASVVDGCRIAAAEIAVYPHRDLGALERLLRGAARAVVVTDAVFSMDGDEAPLHDVAALCHRFGALLVVDEAHAVLGPSLSSDECEVVRVGTLSKFLGAMGGFAAGPAPLIDLLINRARPFIFTTASSPADAGAALAALAVFRSEEGERLRSRLRAHIDRIAPGHPSPIVPVVMGDEGAALAASEELLRRGFLVPAIRPPSVPAGSSRLRVTVSAAHSEEQVDAFAEALAAVAGASIDA
jgi:8-amino-7-oxononanoate synthase